MYLRLGLISLTALSLLTACGDPSPKPEANDRGQNSASISSDATASDREIVKAMMSKLKEIADTLEAITDEDSARAASQKLAVIGKEMEALARKVDTDSAGTKMSAMMEANSEEFRQTQGRIVKQLARLAITKPKLMEIVAEEIEKMDF